jgi:hypothetical protein
VDLRQRLGERQIERCPFDGTAVEDRERIEQGRVIAGAREGRLEFQTHHVAVCSAVLLGPLASCAVTSHVGA